MLPVIVALKMAAQEFVVAEVGVALAVVSYEPMGGGCKKATRKTATTLTAGNNNSNNNNI